MCYSGRMEMTSVRLKRVREHLGLNQGGIAKKGGTIQSPRRFPCVAALIVSNWGMQELEPKYMYVDKIMVATAHLRLLVSTE